MSLESQFDAIRTSAAVYPLTSRAFLRITGSDATRWLNGMVTNDIAALAPGEGNYNFLLNAQGRIQGDCTIYRERGDGTTYLLETDKSQIEAIQAHLDKFIIMDDVELAPALADKSGLLLIGPSVLGTLDAALIWPPDPISLSYGDISDRPIVLRIALDQVEIWGTTNDISWVRSFFSPQINPEISPDTFEAFRILSGTPKFGIDITEKYLPQETAQNQALHFNKGCYLGQEIVERIHSRGQVHRTFTQFTLSDEMPQLPAQLESTGKPAGELTSAALIGGTLYALGYARRELLETHQPLTYLGGIATPSTAPKLTTNH